MSNLFDVSVKGASVHFGAVNLHRDSQSGAVKKTREVAQRGIPARKSLSSRSHFAVKQPAFSTFCQRCIVCARAGARVCLWLFISGGERAWLSRKVTFPHVCSVTSGNKSRWTRKQCLANACAEKASFCAPGDASAAEAAKVQARQKMQVATRIRKVVNAFPLR